MNSSEAEDRPSDCVLPPDHPLPPEEVGRYSAERDPDAEQGIANYIHGQAPDETVQHVERVKTEYVMGDPYEIWDVTTDKDRWWVITNLTNLYSQKHFPSLDYTLSFHIGLMMRLRNRPQGADRSDPQPFDEVFRRQEQAKERHERAIEAEDYQSVGMQLRECLLSLISVMRRRVEFGPDIERPKDGDFTAWSRILMDRLCPGEKNKELRQYLKTTSEKTWQLVNWLTHDRSANKTASSISIEASDTIVGHYVQLLMRERDDKTEKCPLCSSRNIRTHFDIVIEPDGAYYDTCGSCDWSSHPGYSNDDEDERIVADRSNGE
ncbi:gamma-glutamylcyclotransferase [Candidatus Binatus sp.]|uniref:gamma-glutamylcyclotransferase n=1 Tax=Candidatus Binatus sp. TaxID=2811406 RepID=UPI003BAF38BB